MWISKIIENFSMILVGKMEKGLNQSLSVNPSF
jgi:hypothetical protein